MSKEDINLPKTSFSMKANLPNKEPEILKIWAKLDLYKKLRKSKIQVHFPKHFRCAAQRSHLTHYQLLFTQLT